MSSPQMTRMFGCVLFAIVFFPSVGFAAFFVVICHLQCKSELRGPVLATFFESIEFPGGTSTYRSPAPCAPPAFIADNSSVRTGTTHPSSPCAGFLSPAGGDRSWPRGLPSEQNRCNI